MYPQIISELNTVPDIGLRFMRCILGLRSNLCYLYSDSRHNTEQNICWTITYIITSHNHDGESLFL